MSDTVQTYLARSILSVGPANPLPQAIAEAIPSEWLAQIPLAPEGTAYSAEDYRRIIEHGIRVGMHYLSRTI
jgi:hypothetical protein